MPLKRRKTSKKSIFCSYFDVLVNVSRFQSKLAQIPHLGFVTKPVGRLVLKYETSVARTESAESFRMKPSRVKTENKQGGPSTFEQNAKKLIIAFIVRKEL